jgi:hypothetical protein
MWIARGEKNAYRRLVGRPQRRRILNMRRRTESLMLKCFLGMLGWFSAEMSGEPSCCNKCLEVNEQLSN